MLPTSLLTCPIVLAALICLLGYAPVEAAPIPTEGQDGPVDRGPAVWSPRSETELVLSDPRLDPSPDLPISGSASQPPETGTGRGNRMGAPNSPSGWENEPGIDVGSGLGGAAVRDALRGFVNVQRGAPGADRNPVPRRGPQGDALGLAGIDLGPAANEWIQETVQGILTSALRLDVSEQGQASFSVLGLGDFSVGVSGDRSEIALTTGDTLLLAAQRPPVPGTGSGGSYAGANWPAGGSGAGSPASGAGAPSESPYRQAMELLLELASHPLSFLVYGLIAIYTLLWMMLSRRAARSLARSTNRWLRRDEPMAPLRSKKRIRVRKRRHKARPSTHRA